MAGTGNKSRWHKTQPTEPDNQQTVRDPPIDTEVQKTNSPLSQSVLNMHKLVWNNRELNLMAGLIMERRITRNARPARPQSWHMGDVRHCRDSLEL